MTDTLKEKKAIWKEIALAMVVMLLWGSLFPMVKIGYRVYSIATVGDILLFAGIRFTVCGMVLTAIRLLIVPNSAKTVRSSWSNIIWWGLFATVLHYAFTYMGLQLTDSSKTALLKQTGVLFYVCFSFLFFKEDRPTVQKIIGVLLGFAGILVINADRSGISFRFGDLLIIGASFCTVFSNIISKKVMVKADGILATGISQAIGGVILLCMGLIMGGKMQFVWDRSALWMIYICVASLISFCVWYKIVHTGELSKMFILKFAEPIFAGVFGWILLHEKLSFTYIPAFLLIAGGITLSLSKKKSE